MLFASSTTSVWRVILYNTSKLKKCVAGKGRRITLNPLQIRITDADFADCLSEMPKQRKLEGLMITTAVSDWFKKGPKRGVKAPEGTEDAVIKLLPNVIAKKIGERVPTGFFLSKISFSGEI